MMSRLAPVTARDGVDTRNKENRYNRETICRSDMIIGSGVPTVHWGDMMMELDNRNAGRAPGSEPEYVVHKVYDAEQLKLRVWQDMIESPEKYGDDICEWMDLNEELAAGPKRWRMQAYWLNRETEAQADLDRAEQQWAEIKKQWKRTFSPIAQKAADVCMQRRLNRDIKNFVNKIRNAVVTIQSAVRGHLARNKMKFRDCYLCLSHRTCRKNVILGIYTCPGCRPCHEVDCDSMPDMDDCPTMDDFSYDSEEEDRDIEEYEDYDY